MRLEARDLAIGYGRAQIGEAIDLAVGAHDILCLLGPNGCGKTTLFKTLLGLIPGLGGQVLIGGDPIARLARSEIARRLAYVPQAHAPPFPFEAIEVVLMGRTARLGPLEQPGKRDYAAAERALDQLGIAALAGRDYSRLSGGERQLVLIARALAQESPLIVMDEPTASLDFGNQARVLSEIAALARSAAADGRGVILSTHHPDHAFALGADVALMRAGRIVARGRPRETLTRERLSQVYGVPVTVERTESGRLVTAPEISRSGGASEAMSGP